MTGNSKDSYIEYRIKKAEESLRDALFLIEKGSWNAAINRLYYSYFYAVLALLYQNNIEVKSHKGVRNQLSQKFIKTGIISKEIGQIYSDLFDFRQKCYYGDFLAFNSKKVGPFVPKVKELIEVRKHMLGK